MVSEVVKLPSLLGYVRLIDILIEIEYTLHLSPFSIDFLLSWIKTWRKLMICMWKNPFHHWHFFLWCYIFYWRRNDDLMYGQWCLLVVQLCDDCGNKSVRITCYHIWGQDNSVKRPFTASKPYNTWKHDLKRTMMSSNRDQIHTIRHFAIPLIE